MLPHMLKEAAIGSYRRDIKRMRAVVCEKMEVRCPVRNKRVLILSEGFGSGHTKAAYGLAAGLKAKYPGVRAKVLELGSFLNPSVAPLILSAYRRTVSLSPALVGKFYRSKYHKPIHPVAGFALHMFFYSRALKVIRKLKPDLIVCTHPIPEKVMARLKADGKIDVPLCTLITDYDAHGAWVCPEIDRYLVSTQEVKELLMGKGVSPSGIEVTGIPVHPKFWRSADKKQVRRELGLEDMPTVLVMGGGFGLLFDSETMERMAAWRQRVQLVICTGTNAKLAEKLQKSPSFRHPHIHILGMTNQIDKWMDACDLLVTKPGGITCTEGLAKGVQMLFAGSIPGQEERNSEYFVKTGLGTVLKDLHMLDQWFMRLASGRPVKRPDTMANGGGAVPGPVVYEPEKCALVIGRILAEPGLLIEENRIYL